MGDYTLNIHEYYINEINNKQKIDILLWVTGYYHYIQELSGSSFITYLIKERSNLYNLDDIGDLKTLIRSLYIMWPYNFYKDDMEYIKNTDNEYSNEIYNILNEICDNDSIVKDNNNIIYRIDRICNSCNVIVKKLGELKDTITNKRLNDLIRYSKEINEYIENNKDFQWVYNKERKFDVNSSTAKILLQRLNNNLNNIIQVNPGYLFDDDNYRNQYKEYETIFLRIKSVFDQQNITNELIIKKNKILNFLDNVFNEEMVDREIGRAHV